MRLQAKDFSDAESRAYFEASTFLSHPAVFDPEGHYVVVGMPQQMIEGVQEGTGGVLSVREMEILLLVTRGLSNSQIARSLRVSEATVKRHLANAYPKIGVSSRGEAVRQALLENWITIEDVTHREEEERQEQDIGGLSS